MPFNSTAIVGSVVAVIVVIIIIVVVVMSKPGERPVPERDDHRCGYKFDNAKCGPGRCCSKGGWCGDAGQPHCTTRINLPGYNGVGAVVV